MKLGPDAAAAIRLGVLLLVGAAAVGVWELWARQAPGAAFFLGLLPGPIAALRELAGTLGVLCVIAGGLVPWAYGEQRARLVVALLALGTVLAVAAQVYGAAHGMHGVQLDDPRADARSVFLIRHTGLLLVAAGLLPVAARVWLRRP